MKIIPKVERHFKLRSDGFYQEVWYHLVQFINEETGIIDTKTDRVSYGGIYKEAKSDLEHSRIGEATYQFVSGEKKRLLAIETI